MELRTASFNVLADEYLKYGDYSRVDPTLLVEGARTNGIVRVIDELQADVVGLQEADLSLLSALEDTEKWQTFWKPKENKTEGLLMLIRKGIEVSNYESREYGDGSGFVMQAMKIGRAVFANTHIQWAPPEDFQHAGVTQTTELLHYIGADKPAVILADCNDRPNGPVKNLLERENFYNLYEDEVTATVNQAPAALDILAIRGLKAVRLGARYDVTTIPNAQLPSDHVPLLARVEV